MIDIYRQLNTGEGLWDLNSSDDRLVRRERPHHMPNREVGRGRRAFLRYQVHVLLHLGHPEDLRYRGPLRAVHREEGVYHPAEVLREPLYRVVAPPEDLPGELLGRVGHERAPARAHLVEDAAEGPDVALHVVGEVLPDLGADVKGRPDLGVRGGLLEKLGDPEVPYLDDGRVPAQKDVRGL